MTYTLRILRVQSTYLKSTVQCIFTHVHNCRGTRDQIATIYWIIEKEREFQKNCFCYFCFSDYAKTFDCVDHNKLENSNYRKEMGISDHLACLLRNLYAGQEATVGTGRGRVDRFKIEKGVRQGCILSPCLFNLYAD